MATNHSKSLQPKKVYIHVDASFDSTGYNRASLARKPG